MNLNEYALLCHEDNKRWWHDATGERLERNKGELLALIHSEVSECLEGVRKGLQDDHLPEFTMETMELVDVLIRVFDYAGGFGLDLQKAFDAKRAYNAQRRDHTYEARAMAGGKAF